jgi:hypothetical protein
MATLTVIETIATTRTQDTALEGTFVCGSYDAVGRSSNISSTTNVIIFIFQSPSNILLFSMTRYGPNHGHVQHLPTLAHEITLQKYNYDTTAPFRCAERVDGHNCLDPCLLGSEQTHDSLVSRSKVQVPKVLWGTVSGS